MKEPKIRLKGFTGEWNETTIGDIAHVVGGGTPSTGNPVYWNGDIQWFTPSEVGKDKYVYASERTITRVGLDESSARLLPANSILLSSRATIGEMSINTCECSTNQGFQSLIPCNADLEFLYSLLLTKKNDLIRESNGSTFLEISANKVRAIELIIPKNDEQKNIGAFFNSLDSLIQSTNKKIESLKQVKAASLQSMFPQEGETTPRVRFKGFEGEWEKVKLDSICDFLKGKGLSKEKLIVNGKYKCVLYGEIFTKYDFEIKTPLSSTDHYEGALSKSGDIIMPGSTTTFGIDLAKAVHVPYNDVLYGGDIIVLRPKNNRDFDSFFLATQISCVNREQVATVAQGITIVHLHASSVAELYYNFPSLEEQQAIASYFKNLDSQIALLSQQLEKLQQIKSACLDKMFV